MDQNFALPHIDQLQSYVPGMPIETLAREKSLKNIIKLASNENPYGASPHVMEIVAKNLDAINRYPDPDAHNLKKALALFYKVPQNMFVVGNGTDEILQMIMRVFVAPNHNVLSPQYSFSSYKVAASSINAAYIESAVNSDWTCNLDLLLNSITDNTKLICLANPGNPSGTHCTADAIAKFMSQVPSNILVILDEAYYEFLYYEQGLTLSADSDPSLALLHKHKNLILTRTFSKAYGLAGLRVGYSIASPEISACINKIKQPFNVNRLAQIAAIAALEDQDFVSKTLKLNHEQKHLFYERFKELNISYIPSSTNFISLVTADATESKNIYNHLLNQGIITRPLNNYGLTNHLRVSIGLAHENKALVDALEKYMVVC